MPGVGVHPRNRCLGALSYATVAVAPWGEREGSHGSGVRPGTSCWTGEAKNENCERSEA